MCVLYPNQGGLSSLFYEKFGEIATVHGEVQGLDEAREDDRGRVVTYHGNFHAPIVLAGVTDVNRNEGLV
jgi:hypothetical protein